MSTYNGAYLAVQTVKPGDAVPTPIAGARITFVSYLYRASDGSHGSAPSPSLVPAGAVIERIKYGL